MSNLTDFIYPKATEQQAKDGVSNSVLMTPLSTAAAIGALAGGVVKEVYTASGVFTKQPDDFLYFVECIGGGASGRNDPSHTSQWGGGGGSYNYGWVPAGDIGATVNIEVGAGGVVDPSVTESQPGGQSRFGSLVSAPGGQGSNNGIGASESDGIAGGAGSRALSAPGGGSIKGGGGGARGNSSASGGISIDAGNGGGPNQDGQAPGGGGGGPTGSGARGEVRVYRFKRVKQ